MLHNFKAQWLPIGMMVQSCTDKGTLIHTTQRLSDEEYSMFASRNCLMSEEAIIVNHHHMDESALAYQLERLSKVRGTGLCSV